MCTVQTNLPETVMCLFTVSVWTNRVKCHVYMLSCLQIRTFFVHNISAPSVRPDYSSWREQTAWLTPAMPLSLRLGVRLQGVTPARVQHVRTGQSGRVHGQLHQKRADVIQCSRYWDSRLTWTENGCRTAFGGSFSLWYALTPLKQEGKGSTNSGATSPLFACVLQS